MTNNSNSNWIDDEDRIDQLIAKIRPKKRSATEARQHIEKMKERKLLKEMESDPLMDTLIF